VLLKSTSCDDNAQRRVLNCLQAMAARFPVIMCILSQLHFGSYLNQPSYAAAASRLPRPRDLITAEKNQGDFDLIGILRHFGLLVTEMKSIGDRFDEPLQGQSDPPIEAQQDALVAQKLEKAIKQVDKSADVARHLTSDLRHAPRVIKVIALPNISRAQLQRVIKSKRGLEQVCASAQHLFMGIMKRTSDSSSESLVI
jgi:hypothetical protein